MLKILLLIAIGLVIGYRLRGVTLLHKVEHTIRVTILSLLFVFGCSIGTNKTLINDFGHYGWQAFVLAVLGVTGSLIMAILLSRFLK